ncbi:MAG: hypothetical protein COA57_09510 [Flavobacteriales bacterium]|nr:MAG: hypothetical protein COA57_09510 [Flavobacteriales bacterium]
MMIDRFLAKQASNPFGWFGSLLIGRLFNKGNGKHEDMGLRIMSLSSKSSILEIGFGNGRLISKMAEELPSGKIFGIDISGPMVKRAKQRNSKVIQQGLVDLRKGSIQNLPYPDGYFDVVFTANTIYFCQIQSITLKKF